jgi:hypothetical protein
MLCKKCKIKIHMWLFFKQLRLLGFNSLQRGLTSSYYGEEISCKSSRAVSPIKREHVFVVPKTVTKSLITDGRYFLMTYTQFPKRRKFFHVDTTDCPARRHCLFLTWEFKITRRMMPRLCRYCIEFCNRRGMSG